jgi:hypothetical protein
MTRLVGMNVEKGKGSFVLINLVAGDFSVDNLGKNSGFAHAYHYTHVLTLQD